MSRHENVADSPGEVAEAVPDAPEATVLDHLRGHVDALRRAAPSWPKRRRVRALQELLLEVREVVTFAIDEMEAFRSGTRISQKDLS